MSAKVKTLARTYLDFLLEGSLDEDNLLNVNFIVLAGNDNLTLNLFIFLKFHVDRRISRDNLVLASVVGRN